MLTPDPAQRYSIDQVIHILDNYSTINISLNAQAIAIKKEHEKRTTTWNEDAWKNLNKKFDPEELRSRIKGNQPIIGTTSIKNDQFRAEFSDFNIDGLQKYQKSRNNQSNNPLVAKPQKADFFQAPVNNDNTSQLDNFDFLNWDIGDNKNSNATQNQNNIESGNNQVGGNNALNPFSNAKPQEADDFLNFDFGQTSNNQNNLPSNEDIFSLDLTGTVNTVTTGNEELTDFFGNSIQKSNNLSQGSTNYNHQQKPKPQIENPNQQHISNPFEDSNAPVVANKSSNNFWDTIGNEDSKPIQNPTPIQNKLASSNLEDELLKLNLGEDDNQDHQE